MLKLELPMTIYYILFINFFENPYVFPYTTQISMDT